MSDEEIRKRYRIVIHGDCRRTRWLRLDTRGAKRLLRAGFSIRRIAEIMRCSERTVQDVKKGLHD